MVNHETKANAMTTAAQLKTFREEGPISRSSMYEPSSHKKGCGLNISSFLKNTKAIVMITLQPNRLPIEL